MRHYLFTDKPEPPLERAIWWLEHVMRLDKVAGGARVLRPHSLQLAWWQLRLLDVLLVVVIVIVVVAVGIVKCCTKICFTKKEKRD